MKIKKWRNLSKGFARLSDQHVLNKSFAHAVLSDISPLIYSIVKFYLIEYMYIRLSNKMSFESTERHFFLRHIFLAFIAFDDKISCGKV